MGVAAGSSQLEVTRVLLPACRALLSHSDFTDMVSSTWCTVMYTIFQNNCQYKAFVIKAFTWLVRYTWWFDSTRGMACAITTCWRATLCPVLQCTLSLFQLRVSADVMEELIVAGADIDRKTEKVRCIAAQLASACVAQAARPVHDKHSTLAALNRIHVASCKSDMTCGWFACQDLQRLSAC